MSNLDNQYISLDIDLKDDKYIVANAIQGSQNSITLSINIYNNGIPYKLDTGDNIIYRLEGSRPDKENLLYDASEVIENTIIFRDLSPFMFAKYGIVCLVITAYDISISNKKWIVRNPFYFVVNENPFNEELELDSDDYNTLKGLKEEFLASISSSIGIDDNNVTFTSTYSSNKIESLALTNAEIDVICVG